MIIAPVQHPSSPFSPALKPILGIFDFVKLSRQKSSLHKKAASFEAVFLSFVYRFADSF